MQGSRSWATVILTLAAAGLWVLSIWVETRWPWLPFDEGGPWPLASSPAWKRAWAIWVVYGAGLGAYWVGRFYLEKLKPHTLPALAFVAALHGCLYLWLISALPLPESMETLLGNLVNRRRFGLYLTVVRWRLPSFLMGGFGWLLFTELSIKAAFKICQCTSHETGPKV